MWEKVRRKIHDYFLYDSPISLRKTYFSDEGCYKYVLWITWRDFVIPFKMKDY